MMRIIGFVLGMGVAGAGCLLWLDPAGLWRPQPDPAIAGPPVQTANDERPDQALSADPNASTGAPAPPVFEGPPPGAEATSSHEAMHLPPDAPSEADLAPTGEAPSQGGRHLFWAPFRSEVAARGFAVRLSADTEVAVEVVAAGSGRYRVGFDYQDETERRALVNRIQVITGLELE
jgi:hypothetical protein